MNPKIDVQGRSFVLYLLTAGLLLVSCSGDGPLATGTSPEDQSLKEAGSIIDVSGSWNWSVVDKLTMPVFVAAMFGIPPEGPITHLVCERSGTMTLTQVEASFSGTAERTAIACETQGGFSFPPPPVSPAFSPVFFNVEGTIKGRSLDFLIVAGPLPVPMHGQIAGVGSGGVATALKATGRTIVPGHPKSPIPLDPPPAGTSKQLDWEAERP